MKVTEVAEGEERKNPLFLAQGDAHLRSFMPKRSPLMADLARRLLLEPGVVMSDSYFSTSADIVTDLKKGGKSWVSHGLRRGFIVPAFREKDAEGFADNFKRGVLATDPFGMPSDARELTAALDASF
jgi:hypothetical protein